MGSELGISAASKPHPSYDPVSIWWACWAGVWTAAVVAGVAYLIVHRHSPILRIRGLGFSLGAIVFLHIYWASLQFGTMIGPIMPGDAQYWLMGTYLPCGLALFHASNTRFLHVAQMQKRYAHPDDPFVAPMTDSSRRDGWMGRFRRRGYTTRSLIIVGVAIALQLFLTLLMWLISRKFHRTWGIPGTEVHGTPMEQLTAMGQGWEWWSTIVGQFFWAWVVGPIVLWRARHIRDTQGWRTQTIGCVLVSLPATPMWLIALYVPAMEVVNKYFIPPQWICLSIIGLEIFTVFLPCWEVMRHQTLCQETLDAIAQWEAKHRVGKEGSAMSEVTTAVDSILSGSHQSSTGSAETKSSARDSILTMGALELVLDRNPAPLQHFAALHDFSGENVAFLTHVAAWKVPWLPPTGPTSDDPDDPLLRDAFRRALHVYVTFVSVAHAEFPINLSSQDVRKLDRVFEAPARLVYGDHAATDPATPFDGCTFDVPPSPTGSGEGDETLLSSAPMYSGAVPAGFSASVFDDAEESIKYLVLTNTWPKFIKYRRSSTDRSSLGTDIV
ncbi:hypothetical protein P168DRAFT_280962 [Aspergillus campestris IBT 28561]|uniref:RGS domain-containing protein n=1 Tax=Aspergillus campestris (strain IBT 28561) TaxID=1392248 RepID=A0A2I1D8C2_ASPC2|nr:uncharacterized protein P168DRAFT_280962 [Aspergillus campestris IBT 28561]PKY06126.1 hypothetical protein P168DRAFT_280962 [Aspergillus campestris IBT 28561]